MEAPPRMSRYKSSMPECLCQSVRQTPFSHLWWGGIRQAEMAFFNLLCKALRQKITSTSGTGAPRLLR